MKVEVKEPRPVIKSRELCRNIFSVLGATYKTLLTSRLYSREEVDKIITEMESKDYDHALQVMLTYCQIDGEENV